MGFISTRTARRIAAVMMALGVILSGVGAASSGLFGPDVQDAADRISPVGESDALAVIGAAVGITIGAAATCYLTDCHISQEDVELVESMEDAQQKADLAAGLLGSNASSDQFLTSMDNFIEDSRAVASMKAKARMVEMINQNVTDAALIETEVDEAVADYYTVRERNIISQWRSHIAQVIYAYQTVQNDSGISTGFVKNKNDVGNLGSQDYPSTDDNKMRFSTVNFTSVNGTKMPVEVPEFKYSRGGPDTTAPTDTWWLSVAPTEASNQGNAALQEWIEVPSVTSPNIDKNVSGGIYLDERPFHEVLAGLQTATDDLRSNYDQTFISTVVSKYQAGEINTSDLITPEMLASEWATSYNETGASVYKWANLAALGLESPDLNSTAYMTVRHMSKVPKRHVTINATGDLSDDGLTATVKGGSAGDSSFIHTWSMPNTGTPKFVIQGSTPGILVDSSLSVEGSSKSVIWNADNNTLTTDAVVEAGGNISLQTTWENLGSTESLTIALDGPMTAEEQTASLGSTSRTYQIASGIGPVDRKIRIPVAPSETLHFKTGAGTWTNFTSRPDQFTPYVAEGESKTIAGVTLSIERASKRDWRTENGMVFARDAPSGGFAINQTYNPNKSVYFAERGTNTSIEKVVGNYTITYAESDNGSSLESIDVHRYNYQTYNASNLEEQLTQLQELRQEIESREVIGTGGGGGWFPDLSGVGGIGGAMVVGAIVLVLLLGRD